MAKKSRGRPKKPPGEKLAEQVGVAVGTADIAELDRWRELHGDKPSRADAVRHFMRAGFKVRSAWRVREDRDK